MNKLFTIMCLLGVSRIQAGFRSNAVVASNQNNRQILATNASKVCEQTKPKLFTQEFLAQSMMVSNEGSEMLQHSISVVAKDRNRVNTFWIDSYGNRRLLDMNISRNLREEIIDWYLNYLIGRPGNQEPIYRGLIRELRLYNEILCMNTKKLQNQAIQDTRYVVENILEYSNLWGISLEEHNGDIRIIFIHHNNSK